MGTTALLVEGGMVGLWRAQSHQHQGGPGFCPLFPSLAFPCVGQASAFGAAFAHLSHSNPKEMEGWERNSFNQERGVLLGAGGLSLLSAGTLKISVTDTSLQVRVCIFLRFLGSQSELGGGAHPPGPQRRKKRVEKKIRETPVS